MFSILFSKHEEEISTNLSRLVANRNLDELKKQPRVHLAKYGKNAQDLANRMAYLVPELPVDIKQEYIAIFKHIANEIKVASEISKNLCKLVQEDKLDQLQAQPKEDIADFGMRALRVAVAAESLPIVSYMVQECKMDLQQQLPKNEALLLQLDPNICRENKDYTFSIHYRQREQNPPCHLEELYRLLLAAKAPISIVDSRLFSMIDSRLQFDHEAVLEAAINRIQKLDPKLQQQGKNIMALLLNNISADLRPKHANEKLLILAAKKGLTAICELLLERGADLTFSDDPAYTAICSALHYAHQETFNFLLDRAEKLDRDKCVKALGSPMCLGRALQPKNFDGLKRMITLGLNINYEDRLDPIYLLAFYINNFQTTEEIDRVLDLLVSAGLNIRKNQSWPRDIIFYSPYTFLQESENSKWLKAHLKKRFAEILAERSPKSADSKDHVVNNLPLGPETQQTTEQTVVWLPCTIL